MYTRTEGPIRPRDASAGYGHKVVNGAQTRVWFDLIWWCDAEVDVRRSGGANEQRTRLMGMFER